VFTTPTTGCSTRRRICSWTSASASCGSRRGALAVTGTWRRWPWTSGTATLRQYARSGYMLEQTACRTHPVTACAASGVDTGCGRRDGDQEARVRSLRGRALDADPDRHGGFRPAAGRKGDCNPQSVTDNSTP